MNLCGPLKSANFSVSDRLLQYHVPGLEIFTDYSITVRGYTAKSKGEDSSQQIKTSADSKRTVSIVTETDISIFVSFLDSSEFISSDTSCIYIRLLILCTRTFEPTNIFFSEPSPPGIPEEPNIKISTVSFVYGKPTDENGIITHQEIEYSYQSRNVCISETGESVKLTDTQKQEIKKQNETFVASLEGLQPFWKYDIRVRVKTYAGYSNFSEALQIQTLPTGRKYFFIVIKTTFIRPEVGYFKASNKAQPLLYAVK